MKIAFKHPEKYFIKDTFARLQVIREALEVLFETVKGSSDKSYF